MRVPILMECGRTVDSTRFAAASRASRSHSDRVASQTVAELASRANSDFVESQLCLNPTAPGFLAICAICAISHKASH